MDVITDFVRTNFANFNVREFIRNPRVIAVAAIALVIFGIYLLCRCVNSTRLELHRFAHLSYGTWNVSLDEERNASLRSGAGAYQHLELLSNAIGTHGRNLHVRVSEGRAIDAGGPTRGYFNLLFRCLKEHVRTNQTDFSVQPQTGFLIPQGRPAANPSNTIFYHIGRIMAYVFFNSRNPVIGGMFDDSIYAGIFCLEDHEIDSPFENLIDATKLKVCETLFTTQTNTGTDFALELEVVRFLQDGTSLTEERLNSHEFHRIRGFYEISADGIKDPFATEGDLFSSLDVEAILKDEAGFRRNLFNYLLERRTNTLETVGSTLYPIHTMAKAMKATAGHSWGDLRTNTRPDVYIPHHEQVNRSSAEIVEGIRKRIQGTLNREDIIALLPNENTFSYEPTVENQVRWIKAWILRPETSKERIEGLLTYWTGSPYATDSLTAMSSYGTDIVAHTCGKYIELPRDLKCSEEEFYAVLDSLADSNKLSFTMG